ncbi:hypothetical protein HaLaN_03600, partial [Haematococcus lacustris]
AAWDWAVWALSRPCASCPSSRSAVSPLKLAVSTRMTLTLETSLATVTLATLATVTLANTYDRMISQHHRSTAFPHNTTTLAWCHTPNTLDRVPTTSKNLLPQHIAASKCNKQKKTGLQ